VASTQRQTNLLNLTERTSIRSVVRKLISFIIVLITLSVTMVNVNKNTDRSAAAGLISTPIYRRVLLPGPEQGKNWCVRCVLVSFPATVRPCASEKALLQGWLARTAQKSLVNKQNRLVCSLRCCVIMETIDEPNLSLHVLLLIFPAGKGW
jgi:hypothetical protein